MLNHLNNSMGIGRPLRQTQQRTLFSNELIFSTIAMLWTINLFISEILKLFNFSAPTALVYFVIYFFALLGWIRSLMQKPVFTIKILIVMFFIFTISILFDDNILKIMFNFQTATATNIAQCNFVKLTGLCVPLLLLSQIRIDYAKLLHYIYRYSVVSVILFICTMFFQIFIFPQSINYMTLAYAVIAPIICLFAYGKARKRNSPIFLGIVGTIFILLGGCRGALLTIAIFIFLMLFRNLHEKKSVGKIFTLLFVSILVVIIILNLYDIVNSVETFLGQYGYSSRLVEKFLGSSNDGDFFQFLDRSQIYERLLQNINFFGRGIYGDWVLNNGVYAHNFFIEILVQYGILLGALAFIFFGYYLIKTTRLTFKENHTFSQYMVYAFVSVFFGKMMFSSSYLIDSSFWFFLSMISIINSKYYIKDNNIYENTTKETI